MKWLRPAFFALLLPVALFASPACASPVRYAHPSVGVSVSVDPFYEPLSPYGDWMFVEPYGWVWSPYVSSGWRPYTTGQWVWTEHGWTWRDVAPWGWAAYHYGRWTHLHGRWLWVPGDVWAPAWVSWRHGPGYIGWAPLGPGGALYGGAYVSVGWVFVNERQFTSPRLNNVVVSRERNDDLYHRTRNVTRYEDVGGRMFNRALPVERVKPVSRPSRVEMRAAPVQRMERSPRAMPIQRSVPTMPRSIPRPR